MPSIPEAIARRAAGFPTAHPPFRPGPTGLLNGAVLLWALCLAAALPVLCGCSRDAGRARNVILVSLDTLRADRLSCYGYERETSPFLDGFAESGTLFETTVAQSPWTLPSHATMLTGRFPHRNGVVSEARTLAPEVPTLATVLCDQGMITGAIVNSHWLSKEQGLMNGFLTYTSFKTLEGNKGKSITDRAIAWLDRYSAKPFFLFVHYYDVHSSYEPEPAYRDLFTGKYGGLADGSTLQLINVRGGALEYNAEDIAHVSDLYDAEIRQLDDQIARLFAHISELGLDENTCVVITADHGEEFMEHGNVLHGRTMYGEVLDVPLIMRGPGIPTGKRVKEIAMLADIMPTVLGRLGLGGGKSGADLVSLDGVGLDGIDLIAAMAADSPAEQRLGFAESDWQNERPDIKRMVRSDRFKLCYNWFTGERELYDLENDPNEQRNIINENPGLADELMKRLEELMTGRRKGGVTEPRSQEDIEQLKKLGYF